MDTSILKQIGNGIVNFAPTLGEILKDTGIGAPAGVALDAVAALGKAFGLGTTPEPAVLATAMLSDPTAQAKVMAAENDYALKLRDDDIAELKAQLADVASARQAYADTTKSTGKRDINLMVMSWLGIIVALVVFGATVAMSMMGKLDATVSSLVSTMAGIFLAKYSTVFDFWFGAMNPSTPVNK